MYLKLSDEIMAMFVKWREECRAAAETIKSEYEGSGMDPWSPLEKIVDEIDELLDAEKKAARFVHDNQLSGEPILSRKQAD